MPAQMQQPELKKTLGFWTILALTITSVLGSGLFFGISIGTKYAGNSVLIAWVIMTFIAVYIAACFGELSAMFPKTGGTYEFSKQAYGRFLSFIVGWLTWLVMSITVVVMVVAAIDYLLPAKGATAIKLIASLIFILVLNVITYVGIEASSAAITAFAVITISLVIMVVVRSISYINYSYYSPFLTHPISGILAAVFFLAETFFGWEAVTFLSEETKNPEKVIPKALVIGTIIIAILGLVLFTAMLGIVPWEELAGSEAPLGLVASRIYGVLGMDIISMGVYLTLIGSAAGGIVSMPRLILALARDRLFLSQFKHIHPKYNTPDKAVVFQTLVIVAILFIGFANYELLLSLLIPLALIMYVFTILTVTILRYKKPDIQRSFKVPFGKTGPILVVLMLAGIIFNYVISEPRAMDTLLLSLSFVFVGFPLYLLVEFYYDPQMITSMNDILSYITLCTERINLPPWVRKHVLEFVGNVKGKTILEFGCSVGTLTIPLLEAVGPIGTVYATNFSINDLKITMRRVDRKTWESSELKYGRLKIIHDLEQMSRLHPDIEYADMAVSVGMLGYLQDVKKVLNDVRRIVPPGAKICFVEYSDYFHVIPNIEWLSSDAGIEKVFRECGFSVRVTRRKGLLWNYIFIYGIRSSVDVVFI